MLGVELLNHKVRVFLPLLETFELFYQPAEQIYSPGSNVLVAPNSLQHRYCLLPFILVLHVWSYLTVLICISLMSNNAEYLSLISPVKEL